MKTRFLRPALPLLALPLLTASALSQTTGVSHPDSDNETTPITQAATEHYVKPSHSVAAAAAAPATVEVQTQTTVTEPGSYPATATSFAATGPAPIATATATTVQTTETAPALIERRPLPPVSITGATASGGPVESAHLEEDHRLLDNDDGVVLSMPDRRHELRIGTILKARLDQTLSTEETLAGARFSMQLLAPVSSAGEVLLPSGSTVLGRVTKVHGGKRISGPATIRLQPESVNLPDGTSYRLAATVSGLEGYTDSKVTGEGTIVAKTHPEIDAAALGLTTGAAAVTGAVIGGGVGAVVGAGIGAGVGTYMWLNREHQERLPAGIAILFSLDEPLQVSPR